MKRRIARNPVRTTRSNAIVALRSVIWRRIALKKRKRALNVVSVVARLVISLGNVLPVIKAVKAMVVADSVVAVAAVVYSVVVVVVAAAVVAIKAVVVVLSVINAVARIISLLIARPTLLNAMPAVALVIWPVIAPALLEGTRVKWKRPVTVVVKLVI
jgi:hypothetical protein